MAYRLITAGKKATTDVDDSVIIHFIYIFIYSYYILINYFLVL